MDKLGKIRRHHWKKRLKISKISKFESDLLEKKKKNENNYSSSKWRNFADVCMVEGTNLPLTIQLWLLAISSLT